VTIVAPRSQVLRLIPGEITLVLDDNSRVTGSHLLVAAGRRPNVEGLGLRAAGVDYDASGHEPACPLPPAPFPLPPQRLPENRHSAGMEGVGETGHYLHRSPDSALRGAFTRYYHYHHYFHCLRRHPRRHARADECAGRAGCGRRVRARRPLLALRGLAGPPSSRPPPPPSSRTNWTRLVPPPY
jgi:hypothetical protein